MAATVGPPGHGTNDGRGGPIMAAIAGPVGPFVAAMVGPGPSWIAIIGPPGPTVGGTSLHVKGPQSKPLPHILYCIHYVVRVSQHIDLGILL